MATRQGPRAGGGRLPAAGARRPAGVLPVHPGQRWRGDPGAPARARGHRQPPDAVVRPGRAVRRTARPAPADPRIPATGRGRGARTQRRADPRGGAGGAHERRPGLERGSDARGFPGVPRRAPRPPAPTGRLGDAAGAAHLRCRRLAGAAPGHRHAAARRALLPRARSRPRRTVRRRFQGAAGRSCLPHAATLPARRWRDRQGGRSAPARAVAARPRTGPPARRHRRTGGAARRPRRALRRARAGRRSDPQSAGTQRAQPVRLRGRQGTDPRRLRSRRRGLRPTAGKLPRRAPGQGAGKARLQPLVVGNHAPPGHRRKPGAARPRPAPALGRRWPPAGAGHRAGGGTGASTGGRGATGDQCLPRPVRRLHAPARRGHRAPRRAGRAGQPAGAQQPGAGAAPARTRRRSATGAAPVAPAAVRQCAGRLRHRGNATDPRFHPLGRRLGARRAVPRALAVRLRQSRLGREAGWRQPVRRTVEGCTGGDPLALLDAQRRALHRPPVRVPRRPVAGGTPPRRRQPGAVHRRPAPAPAAHHGRRAVPRQRAARALPQPAVDRRDAARGLRRQPGNARPGQQPVGLAGGGSHHGPRRPVAGVARHLRHGPPRAGSRRVVRNAQSDRPGADHRAHGRGHPQGLLGRQRADPPRTGRALAATGGRRRRRGRRGDHP
ncbi:putative CobN/Magnesium chelatase [Pseudomonas aeruginosa NCMG1179]|nr:putative CobN/Magnesium chelatase [Pseudomonas aeruginosa NCMG1179]